MPTTNESLAKIFEGWDGYRRSWTVADLQQTYRHTWNGNTYAITRQWTLWRILAHDLHHGGELAVMLGMQGIENFELGHLGGHVVVPPLADQEG
jgi:hypothetical protein